MAYRCPTTLEKESFYGDVIVISSGRLKCKIPNGYSTVNYSKAMEDICQLRVSISIDRQLNSINDWCPSNLKKQCFNGDVIMNSYWAPKV